MPWGPGVLHGYFIPITIYCFFYYFFKNVLEKVFVNDSIRHKYTTPKTLTTTDIMFHVVTTALKGKRNHELPSNATIATGEEKKKKKKQRSEPRFSKSFLLAHFISTA